MSERTELRELLAEIAEKAENYLATASLALRPEIHVQGLTHGMREIFDMTKGYRDA